MIENIRTQMIYWLSTSINQLIIQWQIIFLTEDTQSWVSLLTSVKNLPYTTSHNC
jgi:hypothetical protein